MSQQNVSLVQGLYEAFARGDIPAILEAMDPDIVWNVPQAPGYPLGGVRRGPQSIASEFFSVIPTYYLELAATADHISGRWRSGDRPGRIPREGQSQRNRVPGSGYHCLRLP